MFCLQEEKKPSPLEISMHTCLFWKYRNENTVILLIILSKQVQRKHFLPEVSNASNIFRFSGLSNVTVMTKRLNRHKASLTMCTCVFWFSSLNLNSFVLFSDVCFLVRSFGNYFRYVFSCSDRNVTERGKIETKMAFGGLRNVM